MARSELLKTLSGRGVELRTCFGLDEANSLASREQSIRGGGDTLCCDVGNAGWSAVNVPKCPTVPHPRKSSQWCSRIETGKTIVFICVQ